MDEKYKACCFVISAVVGAVVGGLIDYYGYKGDAWRGAMIGASIPTLMGIIYLIKYKINARSPGGETEEINSLIAHLNSEFKYI